jgi:PGF-pre-PGF domain-containing protein
VVLNFAPLKTGDNVTVGANNVSLVRESTVNYTVVIPNGTVISGASGWDGKIEMPMVNTSTFTAPSGGTAGVVLDMGSNVELNFSQPVKIVIGGQAGKHAAWARGSSTLTDISTECNSLTNPTNINPTTTRECYKDSGSDLVIWTYHFTSFATYTPAPTITTTGTDGAPPTPTPQATQTFASVAAGTTATMPVAVTGLAVSEIAITVENAATSVQIHIEAVTTPANGTPTLAITGEAGAVYSYMQITTTNLPNDNIASAKIKFTVPKSWLTQQGLTASDVSLFRLATTWNELTTTVLSEDATNVYFEATTPGFSLFAVFASTPVTPTQFCVPNSKQCSGNDIQACNVGGTAWQTTETCANGCNTTALACNTAPTAPPVTPPTTPPAPTPTPMPLETIAAAIVVLVIVGGFAYYKFFMKHGYHYRR